MYYCLRQKDSAFLQQLLPRNDARIGFLEMTAVWLLLATFGQQMAGHLLSLWIDNQGCLYALIKASSKAP